MKIFLISGSVSGEKRYGKLKSVGSYTQPYGLLSVAAILESHGHEIEVFDREVQDCNDDILKEIIEKEKPDLIGMAVFTIGYKEAIQTATLFKKYSKIPIMVGGPHAFVDFENFSKNECFDYFIIGEGEITTLELVSALSNKTYLEEINGLAWRKNGKIKKNPPRERMKDIDILPFPAFHLLDKLSEYHPSPLGYRYRPFFPLVTSRGCPYHCVFCSTIWGHRWVAHSSDYVLKLLEHLVNKFGAREIWFAEDTFVIDKKRVAEICQGIIDRKLKLSWSCMANIHPLDKELLILMKRAGCWQMQVGLEAGNDQVLKFIGKNTTKEMIREKVKLIYEAGIQPRGYFILDHLIDTKETMQETIDFAMSLPLYSADFHLLQLPLGSRAREIAHDYGIVDYNTDFLTGYSSEGLSFVPKGMDKEYLFRTQRKAHLKFFLRPKQILRMISTIKSSEDIKRYFLIFIAGIRTIFG